MPSRFVRGWWKGTRAFFTVPVSVPLVPERNALEFVFKAVLGIWLLPAVIGGGVPRSLEQSPAWMTYGGPWAIIVGCAISVAGFALTDRDDGINLQQLGIVLVAAGLAIYATAVVTNSTLTQTRVVAGGFYGLSLGLCARWWQLQRYTLARRREAARGVS